MDKYDNECPYHQNDAMVGNRSPMVATFVGQRTCGTEHFHDGNQAKKQEYDPNDFVAFKYVFNKIHIIL